LGANKKLDFNNYDDNPSEQHNILTNEQKVIPIKEERFTVEVPILNEGIYINGRRLKDYDKLQGSEILSSIKDRKIKVGELVIKKNRVKVNNKIEIDIKKEETTVKYPDVLSNSGTDES
jgi:hypothetical protein